MRKDITQRDNAKEGVNCEVFKMKLPVNYDDISPSERREVRNEYVSIQKGECYYCGCLLNCNPHNSVMLKPINVKLFPSNFFKYPIHLHHDHKTGMTIGAVHAKCNAVLWQYHGE